MDFPPSILSWELIENKDSQFIWVINTVLLLSFLCSYGVCAINVFQTSVVV